MIKLNEKGITLIRENKGLFIKIQADLGVSEKTMYNYINENSENLTKLCAINTLVNEANVPLSELIDGGKVSKLLIK